MQRRNVDLPDPEGPSRHMTSLRWTSSVMPFSTSSRPKRLWTASALTMGWAGSEVMSLVISLSMTAEREPAREHSHVLLAAEAAPEPALDEVLADVGDARHRQVPDRGHDQERDRQVVHVVDLLDRVEQLGVG